MSQPNSYQTQTMDNAGLGGHHIHRDDEPLPGATGGGTVPVPYQSESFTIDPNNSTTNQVPTQPLSPTGDYDLAAPIHQGTHIRNINNKQRTMENETIGSGQNMPNVVPGTQEPTSTSSGQSDHLKGSHQESATGALGGSTHQTSGSKPGLGDKLIGKTQEITGKTFNNQGLKEKGELRQQGQHY